MKIEVEVPDNWTEAEVAALRQKIQETIQDLDNIRNAMLMKIQGDGGEEDGQL